MSTSSILGQYEAGQAYTANTDRVSTDKDTFLKLLVAQLTHQDPLNPVEDKEFIAQLAQFTQVEELQNIRSAMDGLGTVLGAQQVTNAASLMGLLVLSKGDNIYIGSNADGTSAANNIDLNDESTWPRMYFTPQQDIAEGTLNITDSATGKIVYSIALEPNKYKAGMEDIPLTWHGRDADGQPVPTGTYIFSFNCKNSSGNGVMVDTYSTGQIVGLETADDGNHKLTLSDGRTVNYMDIRQLLAPLSSGGGSGATTDTDTEDETGAGAGTDTTVEGDENGATGETTTGETGTDTTVEGETVAEGVTP